MSIIDSEMDNADLNGAEESLFLLRRSKEDINRVQSSSEVEKQIKHPFPKGVIYILGCEFCERSCFYGLRAVLVIYMTERLELGRDMATILFHCFSALAYISPLFGAILADSYYGRYSVIVNLSKVYLVGTIILAGSAMLPPFWVYSVVALSLIGVGAGGIKPCVSAIGGDQFHSDQNKELDQFFSIFYCTINVGAFLSIAITPIFRARVQCFGGDCYPLAFGVPALLMAISLLLFVAGRSSYRIMPPAGNLIGKMVSCLIIAIQNKLFRRRERGERAAHWLDYAADSFEPQFIAEMKILMRVLWLLIPLPMFWALFDQQGSRWILQAKQMDGQVSENLHLEPDQINALNPILIVTMIPLSEAIFYPLMTRFGLLKRPLQRMGLGMFVAGLAFVIAGFVQLKIQHAAKEMNIMTRSAVMFINDAPCNLSILAEDIDRNIKMYKTTEQIMVPPGELAMRFSIDESACPNITHHTTSLTLDLEARIAYCVVIANKDGLLSDIHFKYPEDEPDVGHALVNLVSTETMAYAHSHQIILGDGAGHRYTYIMTDFSSTAYTEVAMGKYTEKRYSTELEFKDKGIYTVVVNPDDIHAHHLENVEFPSKPQPTVSVLWQIPQYVVITGGEILFSISALQFAYSQAPVSMKSVLQAALLLTVAMGNLLNVLVVGSQWVKDPAMELFLFASMMGVTVVIFSMMAYCYKYVTVINEPDSER